MGFKDLTPIDTEYRENYFRLRTEARWAVFFEQIGWIWTYEKEGFQLKSGWYLPDFYFPDIDCFAEVKPFEFTEEELNKCVEISAQMSKEIGSPDIVLLSGNPECKSYRTFSAGVETSEVVFIPKGQKYYPFYHSGGSFDKRYFEDTYKAVRYAKMARFEFEWKEK